MQANTLAPCGISDMQIAGDSLAERATNEAVYDVSNSTIGDPYGIPVNRMDSHGGWIATATDLLKFLVHTDGLSTAPDIIRSDSTDAMTTGTMNNPEYGRGWGIGKNNIAWGHNGELGGTISTVSKQEDGFYFALIANGNGIDLNMLGRAMCDANPDWGTGTVI